MKKIETVAVLLALTSASSVWAAHDGFGTDRPIREENKSLSVQEGKSVFSDSLKDEVVGVSPQVGVIGFADSGASYHTKAAEGVVADINIVPLLAPELRDYFGSIDGCLLLAPGLELFELLRVERR